MEKEYLIKANEKGYDEMTAFLGEYEFKLRFENGKDCWVKGKQKIESNPKENTLSLINVEDFVKRSLEHIASQERIRNY